MLIRVIKVTPSLHLNFTFVSTDCLAYNTQYMFYSSPYILNISSLMCLEILATL